MALRNHGPVSLEILGFIAIGFIVVETIVQMLHNIHATRHFSAAREMQMFSWFLVKINHSL